MGGPGGDPEKLHHVYRINPDVGIEQEKSQITIEVEFVTGDNCSIAVSHAEDSSKERAIELTALWRSAVSTRRLRRPDDVDSAATPRPVGGTRLYDR